MLLMLLLLLLLLPLHRQSLLVLDLLQWGHVRHCRRVLRPRDRHSLRHGRGGRRPRLRLQRRHPRVARGGSPRPPRQRRSAPHDAAPSAVRNRRRAPGATDAAAAHGGSRRPPAPGHHSPARPPRRVPAARPRRRPRGGPPHRRHHPLLHCVRGAHRGRAAAAPALAPHRGRPRAPSPELGGDRRPLQSRGGGAGARGADGHLRGRVPTRGRRPAAVEAGRDHGHLSIPLSI